MLHSGLLRGPGGTPPAEGSRALDWPLGMRQLLAATRDPRLQAYYRAGAPEGSTPLHEAPLMALDVETTGLDPERDGILSIGLVPMSLSRIRSSQARHWLLKPRLPLSSASVAFHGITHAHIRHAPDLLDVLEEVLGMMAGHVMVVHCREIERQFLRAAVSSRVGEGIQFPVIDTMALEARLHRQPQPWQWLPRWLHRPAPPVSIRLAASRDRYGLPRYRLHHALTDALATAELLQAQVAHRFTPDTPLSALWS